MLLIFLARENFQTVMLQLLYAKLRQHIKIHISRMNFAVKRCKHIPKRFEHSVRCTATQFHFGKSINKTATLIRMQINQHIKIHLAQTAGAGHQRQQAIVLALLINRDNLI